ncbi:MAG: hypothetical protein JNM39_18415 [Bdellovibrionaceae bacterium]|nr:hypothetical protein [Pseudobdellovibrionaceae bacterium]
MNIHLSIPDEAEVKAIYEAYRIVAEPDSPVICYKDLNQADREKIVRGYQRFFRSANCDGQTVGWITVIDRESDPDVNLGFGLFPEFRGRGLMAQIIRHSIFTFYVYRQPRALSTTQLFITLQQSSTNLSQ